MFNRTSLHVALLMWGCIFSIIAFVCMIISNKFSKGKRKSLLYILGTCAVLLFCDSLAWEFRGRPGTKSYWIVTISNFMVFFLSDVLLALYNSYIWCSLYKDVPGKQGKVPVKRFKAVYMIAAAGIIMCIISQFTDFFYYIDSHNYYHRNKGHIFSMLVPVVGMIIDTTIILQERKRISRLTFISTISYIVLPFIAAIVQIFFYGISITNIAISISVIVIFVAAIMEQNENLAREENEAARLRISIMISQIAPHFIYNTLTTIKEMCDTDPEEAGELTGAFSEYLRGNLESLNLDKPIPFERELKHTKCYVAIEKKRFGKKIDVEYDIKYNNFLLPALTLQPLVENAIKYGLCKKRGGGSVVISTEKIMDNVYVIIKDNGTGFDTGKDMDDDRIHTGIENVRGRLKAMSGGSLQIESTVGVGTVAKIILPQDNFVKRR